MINITNKNIQSIFVRMNLENLHEVQNLISKGYIKEMKKIANKDSNN